MVHTWNVGLSPDGLLSLVVSAVDGPSWSGTGATVTGAVVNLAISMGGSSIITSCKAEQSCRGGYRVMFFHKSMKMFVFETPSDCKNEIDAMIRAAFAYAQSLGRDLSRAGEVVV